MRRLLAILVTLAVVLNFVWVKPAPAYAAIDYNSIRVRLSSMGSITSVPVTVQGGYTIKEDSSIKLEQKAYTVKLQNGKLVLTDGSKNWNLGTKFTFKRSHGSLRINNPAYGKTDYLGDMEFRVNGSSIMLINELHLELYLYGVVPSEMPNSWPLEALKAQAVAARTYAANKIRAGQTYALVDTQSDQVYRGYNKSASRAIQAVDATRGQVLKYKGSFAETFYSSSNGGITERAGNAFASDRDYLKIKEDKYDLNPSNPKASWTVTYAKEPVDKNLQSRLLSNSSFINYLKDKKYSTKESDIKILKILDLKVEEYNDSKRLQKGKIVLEVEAAKADNTKEKETIEVPVTLTKSNTRSLLKLDSLLFEVTTDKDETKFIIKGAALATV